MVRLSLSAVRIAGSGSYVRPMLAATAQVAVLYAFSVAGQAIVCALHLPLPGNVVGMALFFAALWTGIVKERWFEASVRFLMKHLTFFFIPLIVGVMDSGALLAHSGIAIGIALALSAAIGIATTALVAERLGGGERK